MPPRVKVGATSMLVTAAAAELIAAGVTLARATLELDTSGLADSCEAVDGWRDGGLVDRGEWVSALSQARSDGTGDRDRGDALNSASTAISSAAVAACLA